RLRSRSYDGTSVKDVQLLIEDIYTLKDIYTAQRLSSN
ncbi:MAG: hypothetical protein ACI9RL_001632, partial [Candidatus Paceibacteria bacterium]